MKRLPLFFLFISFFISSNFLFAQSLSLEQTRKIIVSNKWILSSAEEDGDEIMDEDEVPKLVFVFNADGTALTYEAPDDGSDTETGTWSLSSTHLYVKFKSDKSTTKYSYKLKRPSAYYLYLEDTEEETTLIFKQVEDPEELTGEVEDPQWYLSYTKGEKNIRDQNWARRTEFPSAKISEDWKNGFYITDISYGTWENEKVWYLVTTKNNFTDQLWRTRASKEELITEVQKLYKEQPAYYISHLAYGNGLWVLVSSKGTGLTSQKVLHDKDFPEARIKELWKEGYVITDMANGGGWWVVVMSKGSTIEKQHFHLYDSWDEDLIFDEWDKDDYLTEAVKTEDGWYMIFSSDEYINDQDYDEGDPIPDKSIKEKWDSGYYISRVFFY